MNKLFIGLILILLISFTGCVEEPTGEAIAIQQDSCALMGDVDGDGQITCNDVLLIFNYVLGISELNETQQACADINQDGEITARDVQLLLIEYNLDCSHLCPLLGDVTGNGLIECKDVECIMNHVLGKTTSKECLFVELCGDINRDGKITAEDAQQLMIQEGLNCSNVCFLLGDVDGDGQLTCDDVECIFKLVMGTPSPNCVNPQCADMNQDGRITGIDAQILVEQEGLNCSNECELLGDITGDGEITCMDLKCAIELFKGTALSKNCINFFCADMNEDGKINAIDVDMLNEIIHSPQGTCSNGNCINGECVTETIPEPGTEPEPGNGNGGNGTSTPPSGGGSWGGGGGGGLRQCTEEDIVYGEWNECINGIQSREYSLRTRCAGRYQDFLEEIERTCEMPPEPEGTAELTGICTPEKEGVNCLKDGQIGVCRNNECVLPETTQESKEELIEEPIEEKESEIDLTFLIGGILLLLILIVVAFYIIQKNKKE